ncbi:DNA-directed DNA polymerase eta rad30 [Gaertneriomyces sp. JEL0708]|nr:DNA-directed DNA polymerase eta rad30 [Gaertneriomyces sp. JEL0708]
MATTTTAEAEKENVGHKKKPPQLSTRAILHIDLDCFYCQVEHHRLEIPYTTPLAVQQWFSLVAVNYPARAAGVTRFMTIVDAKKQCPEIVFVHVATYKEGDGYWAYHPKADQRTHKVSLDPYRVASAEIMSVFQRFATSMQKASVDEAYLDVTDNVAEMMLQHEEFDEDGLPVVRWTTELGVAVGQTGDTSTGWEDLQLMLAARYAQTVRKALMDELGYTCSAGVAHTKMLAKLGSGANKPNQQTILRQSEAVGFLAPMPLSKIPSFGGKHGQEISQALGITTVADLGAIPLSTLQRHFPNSYHELSLVPLGKLAEPILPSSTIAKSLGSNKSLRPPLPTARLRPWLHTLTCELYTRSQARYATTHEWPKFLGVSLGGDKTVTRRVDMVGRDVDVSKMSERVWMSVKDVDGVWGSVGMSVGGLRNQGGDTGVMKGWLDRKDQTHPLATRDTKAESVTGEITSSTVDVPQKMDPSALTAETPSPRLPTAFQSWLSNSTSIPTVAPIPSMSPPNATAIAEDEAQLTTEAITCTLCNTPIPASPTAQREHRDFHTAMDLHREMNPAAPRNNKRTLPGSGGHQSTRMASTAKKGLKKRKGEQQGLLDGFFGA